MKIELQVKGKGKEVIIPEFDIFLDELGIYAFLILNKLTKLEQTEINSELSKIFFEGNNLILEISSKYFAFNLDDFEGFKNSKNSVAFVFYNDNGKNE